jgi:adenylate kinase family enzyme
VGKGTQCVRIAKEFDFHHICVGDLLRDEAKSPTSPYKYFIPESIKKSILLPAQLTTMLLNQEMKKAEARGSRRFLVDGFPRSLLQATDFELKVCVVYVSDNNSIDIWSIDLEPEQHDSFRLLGSGNARTSGTACHFI